MRGCVVVAVAVLAACFVVPGGLRAQDGGADRDAEARKLFEAASLQFESERYESALGLFQAAHEMSGRAPLLYNIALCHERLGQVDEARRVYRQYLDTAPDGELRAKVEGQLKSLDALSRRLERERLRAEEALVEARRRAEAAASEQAAATAAAAEQRRREAAQAASERAAAAQKTEAVATPGEAAASAVSQPGPSLQPLQTPSAAPVARSAGGSRWWIWASVGVAVVAGGVTAAVLLAGDGGPGEPGEPATAESVFVITAFGGEL